MKIIKTNIQNSLLLVGLALGPWVPNLSEAQVAQRLLESFGDSCPITQGGMANPLNQARESISRSNTLIQNIRADRDSGGCAGALTAAQTTMSTINPQPTMATPDPTGGSTGGGGDASKGGNSGGSAGGLTGGSAGGPTGGTTGGSYAPPVGGGSATGVVDPSTDAYNSAFNALVADDRINALQSRIDELNAELATPDLPMDRQMAIQGEIARYQAEINTITMDQRAQATRARLTVSRRINQAADTILNAIRTCRSAPEVVAQLTPIALNIGSALGSVGEAAGGAASLAMDAVSGIIGSIVSFFRDRDVREASEALDRATAPTAVRCAYLTIGQQYCQTVNQRRRFESIVTPESAFRFDPDRACIMRGFELMGHNIRDRGGLGSEILNITSTLQNLEATSFSETDVERILNGTGGDGGLIERVADLDNYYDYVERFVNDELSEAAALVRSAGGARTDLGRERAERARRLRAMATDIHSRRDNTRMLRESLETYRDNTENNFDPTVSNRPFLETLRTSLNEIVTSSGGERRFETTLSEISDFHREAMSYRWNRELGNVTITTSMTGAEQSTRLRRRREILNHLSGLVSASQDEASRLAEVGVTGLSAVSSSSRREAIGHAEDIQLQNLQVMGHFLKNQLETGITETASRIRSGGGDESVGAMRSRLLGLCESSLSLQRSDITSSMRSACNDIIYRNEGTRNVTFQEMYGRIDSGPSWSTELACHAHTHPDNVSRDR